MKSQNDITNLGSRDNAFDALRLMGAYIVLFSHTCRHFGVVKPAWSLFFTEGSIGVMIFFSITGFVMMPSYERILKKGGSILQFYWNRIVRIFPPIIFSFIVITIINIFIVRENIFTTEYLIYGIKYCIFARGAAMEQMVFQMMFYGLWYQI